MSAPSLFSQPSEYRLSTNTKALSRAVDYLLLNREQCEKERIPFAPSYLHLLPWGVLERICVPYLAQSLNPRMDLPFASDPRLQTDADRALRTRFYDAQESLRTNLRFPIKLDAGEHYTILLAELRRHAVTSHLIPPMATRSDGYGKTINLLHIFGVAPGLYALRARPDWLRYTPMIAGIVAAVHSWQYARRVGWIGKYEPMVSGSAVMPRP